MTRWGWRRSRCSSTGKAGSKYEVLVQLPGVDDPARAKELIGTAAVLEICDVKDGPFASRRSGASAKHGGILPLGTKLVQQRPRGSQDSAQWYMVAKTPVITGREMRNARPGQDEFRKWETNFYAVAGRRAAFRPLHGGQYRQPPGGGTGQPDCQCGDDSIEDRRFGPHHGFVQRRGSGGSCRGTCVRVRCRRACVYNEERSIGPSLGADSIHQGIVAGLAGLVAVIVVMLIYYKRSGVNAVLALILNTIILLAAVSLLPCRIDAARASRESF